MKTNFIPAVVRQSLCACATIVALGANLAVAQAPARSDKIMTIAELRACMKLEQANKLMAAEILQEQAAFTRDQDAIKAEQAEVNQANADARGRSASIVVERDELATLVSALETKGQSAKTDAEKADYEAERTKLVERDRLLQRNIASFNAAQTAQLERINALNARIAPINERNKSINDRVEPHQKQMTAWRDQCGNRRFREEDEIAIKKELAAGK